MKKLILLFIVIFSFNVFAWETNEVLDEFNEPTGEKSIYTYNKYGHLLFWKPNEKGLYPMAVRFKKYLGSNSNISVAKIKLDKQEPFSLSCFVVSDSTVVFFLPQEEFDKIKMAKTLKIVVKDYEDSNVYAEFNIKGLDKEMKKIN